jgi:zinc protease
MMNRRVRIALQVLAFLSIATMVHAANSALWDRSKLAYPPLREVQLPKVDRVVLPNGMVLYILEDHEFPVVQGRVLVRAGSMLDPADKAGLAEMTGSVLRTGGSEKYPGDALDRRLENIGASAEFSLGQTNGEGSFWCLKENAPEILDVMADLLRRPAFPDEKLALAKVEMRQSIAGRNDEPMDILFRESNRLVWGQDHPYAAMTEYATVDAVARQDLVDFHARTFFPDRITLTLWGDFDAKAIRSQVQSLFGDWKPSGSPPPTLPSVPPIIPGGKLAYAQKDGMTNAWIIEGHLGVKASDPDYAAMTVIGEILGGGFSSRLFNEIRTKRGLAYDAGSSSGADIARPGVFFGYAGTRSDSSLVVLQLIQKEIRRITEEPVSEEELNRAKDSILNSYVFRYESKGRIAARMAYLDFFGYPADFTARYPEMVRRLTAQDLLAAAKRQIHPDDLQMLIVGNEKDFAQPLASLGRPVETVDLKIPEPPSKTEIPAVTPQSLAEGKRLLAAAAQATGGTGWAALRDLTQDQQLLIAMQGQQIPVMIRSIRMADGRVFVSQKMPFGEASFALNGKTGWQKSPQEVQELGGEDFTKMAEETARDFWRLFGKLDDHEAQALPKDQIDGKSCSVVRITGGGIESMLLFLDAQTNLPAAIRYSGQSMAGGPVETTEIFGDYRAVGPVKLPHSIRMLQDGQPFAEGTVTSAVANGNVDPKVFEKPVN